MAEFCSYNSSKIRNNIYGDAFLKAEKKKLSNRRIFPTIYLMYSYVIFSLFFLFFTYFSTLHI